LTSTNEEKRVINIIEHISKVNDRVDFLISQLLKETGSIETKAIVQLYDKILKAESVKMLEYFGASIDPVKVLLSKNFEECYKQHGLSLFINDRYPLSSMSSNYYGAGGVYDVTKTYYEYLDNNFKSLKTGIDHELKKRNIELEDLIKYINDR
jgi:hypothetical protein